MTDLSKAAEELPTDLDERLAKLQSVKRDYELQAVEANIAELEKLIAERDKVVEAYDKARGDLARRQSILEKFKETVEPDFAQVLLPDGGTEEVDKIVQDRLGEINEAHKALDTKTADLQVAESRLTDATRQFERASARLGQLRGLPKSVETRLKALEKLQEEINALKAAGDNATAYWLLTGQELFDSKGHVVLPGSRLFSGLLGACAADPHDIEEGENLTSCPAVIATEEVKIRLETAFADYQDKRGQADAAAAALAAAQAAVKETEKTLADRKKALEATIRKWLAAYPDAPEGTTA